MPEINLDDLYDDLNSSVGETTEFVEAPGIDQEVEEVDHHNMFDLDPSLYTGTSEDGTPTLTANQIGGNSNEQRFTEESDLIHDLLLAKGIQDPNSINYENESGQIEQKSFYDLPYEDQLEILNSNDADIDYGLDESEASAVSFLRDNGVTLEEAIEYFQRKAVEDHINNQSITGLDVDQYSDEELFQLHLKSEYPELTDDEIVLSLEKQLEHPELFRKQIDKLRTDFKEIELQQIEDSRQQLAQAEEQRRIELEETLVDVATSLKDIGGLTLDDGDRNQVLDHILSKDMNGVSPFLKSLNSPERLFELAWFATKGKEAFDIVHDYYKKEIAQVSKASFERGKQAALGNGGTIPTPSNTQGNRKSYTRKSHSASPAQGLAQEGNNGGMSINDINID